MTENVNTAAERKQKMKRAGIAGGGLLGIGALASVALMGTGANWTDSEVVGAEFESGSFNLEVNAPGTDGWVDGTTVDGFADLGFGDSADAWGPGDSATSEFKLRLEEGTSHDATVELSNIVDSATTNGWDITITQAGENVLEDDWSANLGTNADLDFEVELSFDADGQENQGVDGELKYTFTAESQANPSIDYTIDGSD